MVRRAADDAANHERNSTAAIAAPARPESASRRHNRGMALSEPGATAGAPVAKRPQPCRRLLGNAAGSLRKHGVGVRPNQANRANDNDENHGQHNSIFRDILATLVTPHLLKELFHTPYLHDRGLAAATDLAGGYRGHSFSSSYRTFINRISLLRGRAFRTIVWPPS